MKTWILAAVASLASFQATAACKLPPTPPTPPSGATASREEMLSAQASLKSYNLAVDAYGKCMDEDGRGEAEVKRVIKQLETLASQFNTELRIFKQKAGST